MSKQSEAKVAQGYNPNPKPKVCMNCVNYKSNFVRASGFLPAYSVEKNKRCGLGGFAVKKTATCDDFNPR